MSLEAMLFFGKTHPEEFEAIVSRNPEYGFALASINVAWMLKFVLDIEGSTDPFGSTKIHPKAQQMFAYLFSAYSDAFEEVFCMVMELVDVLWHGHVTVNPAATIMQFQDAVLKRIPKLLSDTLRHAPGSAAMFEVRELLLRRGQTAVLQSAF